MAAAITGLAALLHASGVAFSVRPGPTCAGWSRASSSLLSPKLTLFFAFLPQLVLTSSRSRGEAHAFYPALGYDEQSGRQTRYRREL